MESAAFSQSLPLARSSAPISSRKGQRRPTRACASNTDEQRAKLEKMLNLDMKPTKANKGQCTCIWCNGTKALPCSWCSGTGYRKELKKLSWEDMQSNIDEIRRTGYSPEKMQTERVPCKACRGFAKLRCHYCRGSGHQVHGFAY